MATIVRFRLGLKHPTRGEMFIAPRLAQTGELEVDHQQDSGTARSGQTVDPSESTTIPINASEITGIPTELALNVFQRGIEILWSGAGQVETIVVVSEPTLDDMLALSFAERLLVGESLPEGARELAEYASLARRGFRPGKCPLDESIEGMFLAIRNANSGDLNDPIIATKFLDRWRQLATFLLNAMAEGRDPFSSSLFQGQHPFRQEQLFLAADRQLYLQDVIRGARWKISLPGQLPRAAALFLNHPKSILFKYWAREDSQAPMLGKYSLLAVLRADESWVLSTYPTDRISIRALADALQVAERVATPRQEQPRTWYAGERHDHSLCGSPHEGTRLSERGVLAVVRRWCQAKPVRERQFTKAIAAITLAAVVLMGGMYSPAGQQTLRGLRRVCDGGIPPPPPPPEPSGPEPLQGDVLNGRCRALFLATETYNDSSWDDLNKPIDDAETISALLKNEYGFECEIVKDPDRDAFIDAVERVADAAYQAGDRLLIYVAGHGDFKTNQSYLIVRRPEGNSAKSANLVSTAEIENAVMRSQCPHVFLMIDACYSGAFEYEVAMRGEYRIPAKWRAKRGKEFIRDRLKNNSRRVLTSGAKEPVPDESPFVTRLINYLREGRKDGILTSIEIYNAVNVGSAPFPVFAPGREGDKGGEFLFVRNPHSAPAVEVASPPTGP